MITTGGNTIQPPALLPAVCSDLKQLQTDVVLEFYCPFFRTSWGVGVLNSAIFNSSHNRVEFGTILESLRNFGGGFEPLNPPPPSVSQWCVVTFKFESLPHGGKGFSYPYEARLRGYHNHSSDGKEAISPFRPVA